MTNPSQSDAQSYSGANGPSVSTSDVNAWDAMIRSVLAQVNTATLVKVQAVTVAADDGSTIGTVDVLPLVAQITSAGSATPHLTVYGLPYTRLQGGTNAVILDPVVGDIGLVVFCSRDISSVVANKDAANPGSRRRFSMADGVYVGGIPTQQATQVVRFSDQGITVTTPNTVTIDAPHTRVLQALEVTGAAVFKSTVEVDGLATLKADASINAKLYSQHKHTDSSGHPDLTGPL